jgi:hypothetical protein
MNHHTPDDRPDPRATFPASPPMEPPRPNWNDDFRLEMFRWPNGDWSYRTVSVHNGQNVGPEGRRNKGVLVELLGRLFPEATIHEAPDAPERVEPAEEPAPDVEPPFDLQPFGED